MSKYVLAGVKCSSSLTLLTSCKNIHDHPCFEIGGNSGMYSTSGGLHQRKFVTPKVNWNQPLAAEILIVLISTHLTRQKKLGKDWNQQTTLPFGIVGLEKAGVTWCNLLSSHVRA